MNKIKYLFFLCCINLSFAADWFNEWFLPDPGLFIWTVITFLIVLAILRWKAWGPLIETLDARAKQIEDSLLKAEKVTAQAEAQAEKNEKVLQGARNAAQEIVTKARDAGDKLKQKLETDGKEQYDSMLNKAKEQIKTAKQKALSEIKNTAIYLLLKLQLNVSNKDLSHKECIVH